WQCQFRAWSTRRPQQSFKSRCKRSCRMPVVAEIIHVHDQRRILVDRTELLHLGQITRYAVGSKPHDLVFALVHLEPEIRGDRRVKKADGMWKNQLLQLLYTGPCCIGSAPIYRRRRPLADTIGCDDGRALIRRTQKCGSSMGEMVLGTQYLVRSTP